jgi:hypothetical protein
MEIFIMAILKMGYQMALVKSNLVMVINFKDFLFRAYHKMNIKVTSIKVYLMVWELLNTKMAVCIKENSKMDCPKVLGKWFRLTVRNLNVNSNLGYK